MTGPGWLNGRTLAIVAAGAIGMAGLGGANTAGLRFNATPSMPLGLWRVLPDHLPLHCGEIVVVCLPNTIPVRLGKERGYVPRGSCPDGSEPLVKPIAATAGDVVSISTAGVAVNGQAVRNTVPLAQDSAGRPLMAVPAGISPVASGEVWLLSGHDPRSFDSRYFGAVPEANVQGIARPIWVLR